jgi:hypothetical protein
MIFIRINYVVGVEGSGRACAVPLLEMLAVSVRHSRNSLNVDLARLHKVASIRPPDRP